MTEKTSVAPDAPRFVTESWAEAVARVPKLADLDGLKTIGRTIVRVFELVDSRPGYALMQVAFGTDEGTVFIFRRVDEVERTEAVRDPMAPVIDLSANIMQLRADLQSAKRAPTIPIHQTYAEAIREAQERMREACIDAVRLADNGTEAADLIRALELP